MSNSWTTVNLADINPNLETVPVGDYTFSLGGAKYGNSDPNRVEVNATIVTEGDFTGRKVFFSYPDPDKYDWSPKALKRLEVALGVDMLPGQDPVEYLNSVGGHRFAAPVRHGKTTPEYPTPKAEVDIFKVRPAA